MGMKKNQSLLRVINKYLVPIIILTFLLVVLSFYTLLFSEKAFNMNLAKQKLALSSYEEDKIASYILAKNTYARDSMLFSLSKTNGLAYLSFKKSPPHYSNCRNDSTYYICYDKENIFYYKKIEFQKNILGYIETSEKLAQGYSIFSIILVFFILLVFLTFLLPKKSSQNL